ncbi:alpha/beta hydrolase fold domain-containing protein [Isoptericola halotolerans]|uniref:Acetyl esterase/lipase n=1 Tax=Isoptericola halotolerans TaxID=300560 RepID=A0ABX1ZZI8_9MICO|nr:alpha/beta hydrolase fold domain-containing protein [Isoptericola halotolerans]NOV96022.1 acetyl esterase/lipase [Isoptericola halotolerans]
MTITDRVLDGPHGNLPVRLYGPETEDPPVAGLVWAHGGGFMHGDLDMAEADHVARTLAQRGIVVVSVDYRLCPEIDWSDPEASIAAGGVRFPVAHDELVFVFRWSVAAGLGAPAGTWSLGGASAGGNLAAGASLRLRDDAVREHPEAYGRTAVTPSGTPVADAPTSGTVQVTPRSVLLAYPVAHERLPEPTAELAAKIAGLPADRNFPPEVVRVMNANYLGHREGSHSPYAFPGGSDLSGLPPTLVVNSDHDALRSSGEAYAAELAAAGTDVLVAREDGTLHGHLNDPEHPGCARSLDRMTTWLTSPLVGTTHEPLLAVLDEPLRSN